jgi:hypothetical protein
MKIGQLYKLKLMKIGQSTDQLAPATTSIRVLTRLDIQTAQAASDIKCLRSI